MNVSDMQSALASHAKTLGVFDRVNKHEPKNAPGNGLSCSIWFDSIGPAQGRSGLNATTGRVVWNVRVYSNAFSEPLDEIDPGVVHAVDLLMAAYSGDFELGGVVCNIDLLGAYGVPLGARAGYVTIDKTVFRAVTLVVPLIANDIWAQVN